MSIAIKQHPVVYTYGHNGPITSIPVDLEDDAAEAKISASRQEAFRKIVGQQQADVKTVQAPLEGFILYKDNVYRVAPSSQDMKKVTGPSFKNVKKRLQAAL